MGNTNLLTTPSTNTALNPSSGGFGSGIDPNVSGAFGSGLNSNVSGAFGSGLNTTGAITTLPWQTAQPNASAATSLDRRIRLRPKSGATSLYYSGSPASSSGANAARQNQLGQALGGGQNTLPWLQNKPLTATSAPNAPNNLILPSLQSSLGVGTPSNSSSSLFSGLFSGVTGFTGSSGRGGQTQQQANLNGGIGVAQISTQLSGTNTGGILMPLSSTNGLVWPYTPTVDVQQAVDYSTLDPVHTLQEFHSFTRTRAPIISVSGRFSVNNSLEAQYALAAIWFCRVVSKMAFGVSTNPLPGTPPPILLFSGYGLQFPDVPVIMQNFTVSYPDDVDYIPVPNMNASVPALFTISCSLVVQHTPAELRAFNLNQFRSGQLLTGWI